MRNDHKPSSPLAPTSPLTSYDRKKLKRKKKKSNMKLGRPVHLGRRSDQFGLVEVCMVPTTVYEKICAAHEFNAVHLMIHSGL